MMRASGGIVVAREPVRVAAAVVVLVVVAHRLHELVREQRPDDLGAEHGVLLHLLPLLRVEAAGLEQDAVGDADLADVVEVGGLLELAAGPLRASRARA